MRKSERIECTCRSVSSSDGAACGSPSLAPVSQRAQQLLAEATTLLSSKKSVNRFVFTSTATGATTDPSDASGPTDPTDPTDPDSIRLLLQPADTQATQVQTQLQSQFQSAQHGARGAGHEQEQPDLSCVLTETFEQPF